MSMYHRFIIGDFVDDPTEIFLTFDCYHHTTTTKISYNSGVVFVLLLILFASTKRFCVQFLRQ